MLLPPFPLPHYHSVEKTRAVALPQLVAPRRPQLCDASLSGNRSLGHVLAGSLVSRDCCKSKGHRHEGGARRPLEDSISFSLQFSHPARSFPKYSTGAHYRVPPERKGSDFQPTTRSLLALVPLVMGKGVLLIDHI